MEVCMIVAAGRDGAIGRRGELIWRISEDLKRFKRLTMGHPVIMGRKTWESLPKRPLPGRKNIILSRDKDYMAEGGEVCGSVEEALRLSGDDIPFVMGGEQTYRLFLPYVSRVFLTEVDDVCDDADAWLSLPGEGWKASDISDWEETPEGVRYRYVEYERN